MLAMEPLCLAFLVAANGSLLSAPQNTASDINHSATSVGTQCLDSGEAGSLSNPVLAGNGSNGVVGAMAVAILVRVILRDGCSTGGTTFKLDMIDTSIDEVHMNTLKPTE